MFDYNAQLFQVAFNDYRGAIDDAYLIEITAGLPPFDDNDKSIVDRYRGFFSYVGTHIITEVSYGSRLSLVRCILRRALINTSSENTKILTYIGSLSGHRTPTMKSIRISLLTSLRLSRVYPVAAKLGWQLRVALSTENLRHRCRNLALATVETLHLQTTSAAIPRMT